MGQEPRCGLAGCLQLNTSNTVVVKLWAQALVSSEGSTGASGVFFQVYSCGCWQALFPHDVSLSIGLPYDIEASAKAHKTEATVILYLNPRRDIPSLLPYSLLGVSQEVQLRLKMNYTGV